MSVILIGVYGIIFLYVDTYLSQEVYIGPTNLSQVNADTLGQISDAYISKMDYLGYIIIFALIMGMLINAYYTRNKYPLLMLLIDILLLIFAFIVAVYVSNMYYLLINSTEFLNVYINNMPKSSAFLLHLPIYCSVIGVLMMILSYIPFPRNANELIQNEDLEGVA
jgi:hypothetical protein